MQFRELVEQVIQQLVSVPFFSLPISLIGALSLQQEGAFAIALKSKHFPGECVVTRRGSPLLVGIKTKTNLNTDHIPIIFSNKGISPPPPSPLCISGSFVFPLVN